MRAKTLQAILFFMMLAGVSVTVSHAQADPDQNPKSVNRQKAADDDDEREERISRRERGQVKITKAQARKIALGKVSGTIVEEELEKEKGVIVYSIEIRDANRKVWDVEVDAKTGAIVRVEEELDDDEDGPDNDTDAAKTAKAKTPPVKNN